MPSYYGGVAQRTDPKFLMDRLMKNGMSRMQAAAIVGNLQRESGLISNNVNKNEGAYGLMQWRGSRFDDLQKFAQSQGRPWTDPATQADFIGHEMGGKERKGAQPFLAARTLDEASAGLKSFIRYGDKSGPERAMHARNFFGAAEPAPQAPAAPLPQFPQLAEAVRPDVSRETKATAYAGDPYAAAYAPPARRGGGMRAGLESLGGLGAAYIDKQRRTPDELTVNPWSREGLLGTSVSGAGGGLGGAMDQRGGLAGQLAASQYPRPTGSYTEPATGNAMLTGAPGRYEQGDVLNLGRGVAAAPPGASEPPRFPGGIAPLPRQRPMTGPGMMQGDYIPPSPAIAELGSLVDPTRYGYG